MVIDMADNLYVNTVLGKLSANELGITSYHEHLGMKPGTDSRFIDSVFDDPAMLIPEVNDFFAAGGKTLVEMSPLNFGRNVKAYREIALKTSVNIICSTGFHKQEFLPDWIEKKDDESIEEILLKEITSGIDSTNIKAGVVKIGTSFNEITKQEQKIIKICCKVQKRCGVPISTHSDKGTMVEDQCHLFEKFDANPSKVIIGHADIINGFSILKNICAIGFNVGIDHIGRHLEDFDSTRITLIKELIDAGFIDQICIAGDFGKKGYLKSYGGRPGLAYIPGQFRESLRQHSFEEDEINKILVENPKRIFGFIRI